jgi:hypothetical protein
MTRYPVDITESLFGEGKNIEGPEIKFRALCAVGWALYHNLPKLRDICLGNDEHFGYFVDWIGRIEKETVKNFDGLVTRHLNDWPDVICRILKLFGSQGPDDLDTEIKHFMTSTADQVISPEALSPTYQINCFNQMGFDLATQMIGDCDWSTHFVASRWGKTIPSHCKFTENDSGGIQPVTSFDEKGEKFIEVRVNTESFPVTHSLPSYFTLEYQFMHEYISHFLPVWNSGGTLEHQFLLAVMSLYYDTERLPADGINFRLVEWDDQRRNDSDREPRLHIRGHIARLVGEKRLSRKLLELAVLHDNEMAGGFKREFLSKLKRLTAPNAEIRSAIAGWFDTHDVMGTYKCLQKAIVDKRLI